MRRAADLLRAELHKAATLPAVWAGLAVTLLCSVAISVINASVTEGEPGGSPFETAFAGAPIGTVGAVVVGVVLVGSEYTAAAAESGGGRQISTTLAAVPHRTRLLAAKAGATVLIVLLSATVTLPVTVLVVRAMLGGDVPETVTAAEAVQRCLGAAVYWALTALIAQALTTVTRSGVVPLVVLIMNSSVVSVSYLLTRLTPLAHWLPDMAGRRLFGSLGTGPGALPALPGGLVMAGWAALLLTVAAVALHRRDA